MAYEALAENVRWTNEIPPIYVNFYVDHYREGNDQYYKIKFTVNGLTGSQYFGYPINLSFTVNGEEKEAGATVKAAAPSGPTSWSSTLTYESALIRIPNATTTAEAVFRVYSGSGSSRDVSYTYTLPYDPGAVGFDTAATGTLGVRQKINLDNNGLAVSVLADVTIPTGGTYTQEIVYRMAIGYVWWTPDLALAKGNPSGNTVSVKLTCVTWDSAGNRVGEPKYLTVSMTIPDTVAPSISAVDISDATTAKETYGNYLQMVSQLRIKTTAVGIYGSSITGYEVSVGGVGSYSGADITTGVLKSSGDITVTVKATDSRGKTATRQLTVYVAEYLPPYLVSISAVRVDASNVQSPDGAFGLVTFSARVTPLSNTNTASYVFMYRIRGASDWTTFELPALSNQYEVNDATAKFPASPDYAYEVALQITDKLTSPISTIFILSSAFILAQTTVDGTGISLGCRATKSNTLEVGMAAIFNEPVSGAAMGLSELPIIPSGSDFNYQTTPGAYSCPYTNFVNSPVAATGVLIVSLATGYRSTSYVIFRQIFMPQDNAKIYIRYLYQSNGSWTYGGWRYIATTAV